MSFSRNVTKCSLLAEKPSCVCGAQDFYRDDERLYKSPPVFVVVLKTFIEMMSVSIIGGSLGNTEQCRPII